MGESAINNNIGLFSVIFYFFVGCCWLFLLFVVACLCPKKLVDNKQ